MPVNFMGGGFVNVRIAGFSDCAPSLGVPCRLAASVSLCCAHALALWPSARLLGFASTLISEFPTPDHPMHLPSLNRSAVLALSRRVPPFVSFLRTLPLHSSVPPATLISFLPSLVAAFFLS
jgi:hypothetical protein